MLSNFKTHLFSRQGILFIIILVICFFSYFQITDYDFIRWDDDTQITDNTYVKNLNWQSVEHNLHEERYTFLTLTIYSVIYNIWGNNPVPFHWFNLLLHLTNVILVYLLAKKLLKNYYAIALVTLLFALHPMRVESVAWISEAKDLLFTFFSLSAFLLYIKYLQNNLKSYFFIFAALMAFLAAFSKIQGLLVPPSFILLDILYKRKFSFTLILEKVVLFLSIFFIFHWFIVIILLLSTLALNIVLEKGKFKINKTIKFSLFGIAGLTLLIFLIFLMINQAYGQSHQKLETRFHLQSDFFWPVLHFGFILKIYFCQSH